MTAAALTFAILAGGAARRLDGRDKGLESLDGRALIDHVLAAVSAMRAALPPTLRTDILIVANRHRERYAQRAPTFADTVPGFRGPLAGVAAALRACAAPWLLSLPVDCPDPPRDLATRLLAAAERDAAGHAFVAHDGERRQPLFALYRANLAAAAAQAAEAGQGVWQWQDAIGARELDFSERRRQFRNLNTPDEFAAYAAEHHCAP